MEARLIDNHRGAATHRSCARAAGRQASLWRFCSLACAYKPTMPPSEGHLTRESVAPAGDDKILPPVTNSTYVPPPKPRAKTPTYSVVVHEVPVKELLLALARDTKENIDIHPGLQGLVSLNAIDETLPAILDRVSQARSTCATGSRAGRSWSARTRLTSRRTKSTTST